MAWWDPEESGGGGDTGNYGRILAEFARRLGALKSQGYGRITSQQRRPLLNARSQHPFGTAADFALPAYNVEAIRAFQAAARRAGLIVVDESTKAKAQASGSLDWTGPHMHVQLFKAGVPRTIANIPGGLGVQISETP